MKLLASAVILAALGFAQLPPPCPPLCPKDGSGGGGGRIDKKQIKGQKPAPQIEKKSAK